MKKQLKKTLLLFLCIALALPAFGGCKKVDSTEIPTTSGAPVNTKPGAFTPYYRNHLPVANELGTAQYLEKETKTFSYAIFHPKTEISAIDNIIGSEVATLLQDYENIANNEKKTVELHLNYVSHTMGEHIAIIQLIGFGDVAEKKQNAVRTPISKTFVFNINTGAALTSDQVFLPEGWEEAKSLIVQKLTTQLGVPVAAGDLSEAILENAADFRENEIAFVFQPTIVLPAQTEVLEISFPYEELSMLLVPDFAALIGKMTGAGAIRVLDPEKPMVALTFDDGPANGITPRILAALEKYDARATFFVVGTRLDGHADILKQTADAGHELACHTWDHKDFKKQSKTDIGQAITSVVDRVYEITGQKITLVRPPYGNVNDDALAVSKELNMPFINWSVDTRDWESKNADSVYSISVSQTGNGSIVLCHDLYDSTAAAMERFIPYLAENGYQMVTISELFAYSTTPLEGGKVFYKREEAAPYAPSF
ncbi:MAG: polysaccharide deacetylase family protein [Christensenellaceae bacterium]|jgi:peptidoglycan/xylan/chitin deacetylase (PgdA/CDA1 family)